MHRNNCKSGMYFRCSENYWLLISPYWSRAINLYSIHRFLYFNFFSLHQLYHPTHLKSLTMRDLLAWITNLLKHWCLSNKAEKTARPLGRKARQNMKREQILADNDIGWFQRKQPSLNSEFTRGGYSWEFLVGVCRPVPQILTRSQTKKM